MNTTRKRQLPYREGSWFAVPLRTEGYAIGLVARMDGAGGVFGYFFGPVRSTVPDKSDLYELKRSDNIFMRRFGDLGLIKGHWPIIGDHEDWHREQWPLPPFVNFDPISGKAIEVVLDDDLGLVSQKECEPSLREKYPQDADSGYGAIEIHLTKILRGL